MSEIRKIITKAGEVLDHELVFEENVRLRTGVPEHEGTVEPFEYTTSVYENGITYKKTAYVYLPYCYDKDDKSRRYNVLYFQHGNTCDPSMFVLGGNRYMLDMLFDSGELDPCIMVFVTYYMDPMRDAEERCLRRGDAEAGDGRTPGIPANYDREIVQDIIPGLESKYNTYLEEPTEAGVKASRDHRAFSGYSRGTTWTWRMFHHAFEYFRWFCPTSGTCGCDWGLPMTLDYAPHFTDQDILDYVTAPIKAHPELPFFIYYACGGLKDDTRPRKQMKMYAENECFSYGKDPTKNNFYCAVSDFYHTDYLIPYYFWNYLQVIFKL